MVCWDYLTFVAKGGDSRVNFVLFLPQIKSWSCTLHLKIVKMHRNLIPWWSLKLVYDKASSQALVPTYHPYHPTHIEGAIKSCNCKNFYYPTSSSVRGGPKNEATATVVLHSGLIFGWTENFQNYLCPTEYIPRKKNHLQNFYDLLTHRPLESALASTVIWL